MVGKKSLDFAGVMEEAVGQIVNMIDLYCRGWEYC